MTNKKCLDLILDEETDGLFVESVTFLEHECVVNRKWQIFPYANEVDDEQKHARDLNLTLWIEVDFLGVDEGLRPEEGDETGVEFDGDDENVTNDGFEDSKLSLVDAVYSGS